MSPAADKGLMLGQSGARRVAVEWENGIPSALSFTLDGPHGERLYTLPVDVPAIQRVLRLYDAWREHETLALPSADGA